MKKYPFPEGVTTMSGPDYAEHCRAMGAADRAAKAARKAEREAVRARRAEVRKTGPRGAIEALSIGAAVTLPAYNKTTQLSSTLRSLYVEHGRRFTSEVCRSLMDRQTVIGVTVRRTN